MAKIKQVTQGFTQEHCDHLKENGFNPHICPVCRKIGIVFEDLIVNAQLNSASPDLYEACKAVINEDRMTEKLRGIVLKALAKANGKET